MNDYKLFKRYLGKWLLVEEDTDGDVIRAAFLNLLSLKDGVHLKIELDEEIVALHGREHKPQPPLKKTNLHKLQVGQECIYNFGAKKTVVVITDILMDHVTSGFITSDSPPNNMVRFQYEAQSIGILEEDDDTERISINQPMFEMNGMDWHAPPRHDSDFIIKFSALMKWEKPTEKEKKEGIDYQEGWVGIGFA